MKRTELKRSAAPMKRAPFVTKPAASGKPVPRAKMKSRGPKMTPIRKSAKGEECTLRFACCNRRTDTTVWCHSNRYEDGKGAGLKARDEEGCYGCSACHAFLDGGYAGKVARWFVDAMFDHARAESQKILTKKGLIQ